jgi:hypothetical protein
MAIIAEHQAAEPHLLEAGSLHALRQLLCGEESLR